MANLIHQFAKLILILGLVAHGSLILMDEGLKNEWQQDVKALFARDSFTGSLLLPIFDKALVAIAGMQVLSVLHFFFRKAQCIAVLNIIGIIMICMVKANPFKDYPNIADKNQALEEFLKNLAIAGGLLWYLSSSLAEAKPRETRNKDNIKEKTL